MIGLALFQPEIPQNAGTLLRLSACLGVNVDIIEPCGFALSDRKMKRAGMDYLSEKSYQRWPTWAAFHGANDQGNGKRLVLLTPDAPTSYTNFEFKDNDILVVGRESDGFPPDILATIAHQVHIPMHPGYRSLNVATAASMVLGEALRQTKKFYTKPVAVEMPTLLLPQQQTQMHHWVQDLQQQIIDCLEQIEQEYSGQMPENYEMPAGTFQRRSWAYAGEGGGNSAILKGRVFEKAGVNVSCIKGTFSGELREKVMGAAETPEFWATGISLVVHPWSPLIPTIHFNTRLIQTTKYWFGGGIDVTPMAPDFAESDQYHQDLKNMCDRNDPSYYPRFKDWCDRYFYLPHRKEMRGISGIFYDHLQPENWEKGFLFTQSVGKFFLEFYPNIVRKYVQKKWTEQQRQYQLIKRGRYVEYNLLYDRGTLFGLKTGGDIDAIFMSLPPKACWL